MLVLTPRVGCKGCPTNICEITSAPSSPFLVQKHIKPYISTIIVRSYMIPEAFRNGEGLGQGTGPGLLLYAVDFILRVVV